MGSLVWRGLELLLLAAVTSAISISTPSEIFVENGTQATLSCTFKSSEVVSTSTTVSWSYARQSTTDSIGFFHVSQGKPYFGAVPQFKDRVSWVGNLNKRDGSITIANMQFRDNGTYSCDVKNPPDITGTQSKIILRVVEKGNPPVLPPWIVKGLCVLLPCSISLLPGLLYTVSLKKKKKKKSPPPMGLYNSCKTTEVLTPSTTEVPKKVPLDTESWVNSSISGPHQGPVIYAQLDHSGGKPSSKVNKSESVVYADIRKN
uniref:Myelin protein zero-like 1 like n=1 Tax=Latimeria chalumnae TaxID=7897 RepID=H3A2D6_LATCH